MLKYNYIKDKNFLLLFFGNLVSGIGSRIYGFGIALFLLDLTGKATVTATYIGIWSFIVFLCGPIAATFTDKWKKKVKVLYLTDFGRGIIYISVGLLVSYFMKTNNTSMILVVIYSALFFIAIQSAFFAPATTALIPQLVEKNELVSASSIMQITRSVQTIAGLLFGAVLYLNFGIVLLMVINGISFILSAISEMFIKYDTPKNLDRIILAENNNVNKDRVQNSNSKIGKIIEHIYVEIKEAVRYIFHEGKPILMITLIVLVSTTLTAPWFSVGVPYMIKEYFTFDGVIAPEYLLALSEFAESIGIIILSIVISIIASKFKIYQLFRIGGSLFILLAFLYYMIIRSFDVEIITINMFIIGFILINFMAGSINAIVNAPLQASMQKYIEPDKIGKVSMLIDCIGGILFPITALLAGFFIDNYSIYYPLAMMIAGMVIITLIAFRSKELKKLT
ncbi:MAG: MFS transporter [Firmicutes bacterium]|nr:MFS transporter [Bacillota bacterium]